MPGLDAYDYAVVRVVPRVERGEYLNVGVILHCRVRRFLGARIALDQTRLRDLAPGLDVAAVQRQLAAIPLICAGGEGAGPIGTLPLLERFDWLVAKSSTMIQTAPVHCGLTNDPAATLDHLLESLVAPARDRKTFRPGN